MPTRQTLGDGFAVREERPGEGHAIGGVVERAFANAAHSGGNESRIVAALRVAGGLTLSLVAERRGAILGHVAFSPVTISGAAANWFGLGPVAVEPSWQAAGVGSALISRGLEWLREAGAQGCVVLGDPAYYGRFGFVSGQGLSYPGPPAEYFQSLPFGDEVPQGIVAYHPAFATP